MPGAEPGMTAFLVRYCSKNIQLQQHNPFFGRFFDHPVRPEGTLDLPDMGLAQIIHTDSGLADAAADGLRQFAVKECLLEWQLSPLFAACFF